MRVQRLSQILTLLLFSASVVSAQEAFHRRQPNWCDRLLRTKPVAEVVAANFQVPAEAWIAEYPTYPMIDDYLNEELGAARAFEATVESKLEPKPYRVAYLRGEVERLPYQIFVHENAFVDREGRRICPGSWRCAGILVMDEYGRLFFTTGAKYKEFHHSSFFAGAPVAYAGEVKFRNGQVLVLRNRSGHYPMDAQATTSAVTQLLKLGLTDLRAVGYDPRRIPARTNP